MMLGEEKTRRNTKENISGRIPQTKKPALKSSEEDEAPVLIIG